MPTVGYCHDCADWVWVTADSACPKGHPAERVNGCYDSETGGPVPAGSTAESEPAREVAQADAGNGGTRAGFLVDLMSAISHNPAYSTAWGTDTDMVIVSNPIDGTWGVGRKKAEYSAAIKVSEIERVVYFWEILKEQSSGFTFGTFESESYSTVGMKRSGTKKETAIGPGGGSWQWGYGTTRAVVEEVAARHGFTVNVVLARGSAAW